MCAKVFQKHPQKIDTLSPKQKQSFCRARFSAKKKRSGNYPGRASRTDGVRYWRKEGFLSSIAASFSSRMPMVIVVVSAGTST